MAKGNKLTEARSAATRVMDDTVIPWFRRNPIRKLCALIVLVLVIAILVVVLDEPSPDSTGYATIPSWVFVIMVVAVLGMLAVMGWFYYDQMKRLDDLQKRDQQRQFLPTFW